MGKVAVGAVMTVLTDEPLSRTVSGAVRVQTDRGWVDVVDQKGNVILQVFA